MPSTCLCGCGTEIAPTALFVRGHHWRLMRERAGIPEEKVCERCGKTYRRADLDTPQSTKHWVSRRFCGDACRRADRAEQSRAQRGSAHPGWKGDAAAPNSGRMRAQRQYREIPPCEVCGSEKSERHHKDGDTRNNDPSNVAFLCRKHHIAAEDRMAYRRVENMTPEQQAARLERLRLQTNARQRRYQARKRADAQGA